MHEIKGGNHMYKMTGGIYEIYKNSLLAYFSAESTDKKSPHHILFKEITDRRGSTTETQVKVHYRDRNKGAGILKYTVNLYHTQSSMMVNGKESRWLST